MIWKYNGVNAPCGHIVRIHSQACPECRLQVIGLFLGETVAELKPAIFQKEVDLLSRELVLLFCVAHDKDQSFSMSFREYRY